MKATFEIDKITQSLRIDFIQDKDFSIESIEIGDPFYPIRFILSKKGLKKLKKAIRPYKERTNYGLWDFVDIGKGKYILSVNFKPTEGSLSFFPKRNRGIIVMHKEFIERLKYALAREPIKWEGGLNEEYTGKR
mgnify:CR=1 FL=1